MENPIKPGSAPAAGSPIVPAPGQPGAPAGQTNTTGGATGDTKNYDELVARFGTQGQELGEYRQFFQNIAPLLDKLDQAPELVQAIIDGKVDKNIAQAVMEGRVDVRDAARGMMLAAQKGRRGEIYILSGHRITINQLDRLLTKYTKAKLPYFTTPRWLSIFVAWFSPIYYAFYKQTPTFTPYSLRTLFSNSQISSEKAQIELGYNCRAIDQSIKDHIDWFINRGIIKKRRV